MADRVKARSLLLPKIYMLIAIAAGGWVVPLNKTILSSEVTPLQLSTLRFTFAAILVVLFLSSSSSRVKKRDLVKIAVKSTLNIVTFLTAYSALARMSGSAVAILTTVTPLLIYLGATRVLHEKAKRRLLIGLGISFLGALVVSLSDFEGSLVIDATGIMLVAVSIATDAISTLFSKSVAKRVEPKLFMKINFLMLVAGFWLLTALTGEWPTDLRTTSWWLILFSALNAYLGFRLYFAGLKRVKAKDIGVFAYIGPVVGVISSVAFLGEKPHVGFWVGAVLISLGVIVAETNKQIRKASSHHFHLGRHHSS